MSPVPEGAVFDDAADTVIAAFDAETPGRCARRADQACEGCRWQARGSCRRFAVVTDAIAIVDGVADNMYFGGVGIKKQKAAGEVAFFTVGAGVFADAQASGGTQSRSSLGLLPPRLLSSFLPSRSRRAALT